MRVATSESFFCLPCTNLSDLKDAILLLLLSCKGVECINLTKATM